MLIQHIKNNNHIALRFNSNIYTIIFCSLKNLLGRITFSNKTINESPRRPVGIPMGQAAGYQGGIKYCFILMGGHPLFPPKPLFCMLTPPQADGVLKINKYKYKKKLKKRF